MLLSLSGIKKSFGGVAALRSADLQVQQGEGHLLLGENGAGKSTLMRIVAGMLQADSGRMLWRGKAVRFRSPAEASREGIAMVHQESLLAPHLSVAENIFLGRGSGVFVRPRSMAADAQRLIAEHGFKIDASSLVGDLTPAGKQLVELCRAVAHGSSLIVFDEPTSALSGKESEEVFRTVQGLRARGIGIIYITHRLDELKSIGDRATILRDGETVFTGELASLTREDLIQQMVGRRVDQLYQRRRGAATGEVLLRVDRVNRGLLRDVCLEVRAGEILGLAGLMGAGRTELCRVLFGIDPAESGTVEVAGRRITGRDPRQAIRSGVALIPEDRQRHGLVLNLPIASNITLAALERVSSYGFLNKDRESQLASRYRDDLRIRSSSVAQRARQLSGGNQQKVAIAKWMARGARVFLFDEPTRGIDVSAKQEVFEQMDRLAREGAAVLMVSSELSELTQVADRILVMCGGRITGELPGNASQQQIMHLAAPQSERPRAMPA